jgi:predicted nucleic acid-binding protein
MAWVVDTSILIDLITGDPAFESASNACLQAKIGEGLVICPVTFVELGPSFLGDYRAAEAFLRVASINTSELWTPADTELAHRLWYQFQMSRRRLNVPKRPVADVLIAAFASRYQGIITRNATDFRNILPTLSILEP